MATPQFTMAPRVRKDAGAAKKKQKHGQCPFGCNFNHGEDENGYCRHLLGWVHEGAKNITVRVIRHLGNENHCSPTENVEVDGDTVQKTDRVVKMPGTYCRVYRYTADAPIGAVLPKQPDLPPDALSHEQLEDQARDKEISDLKKQLAEMKALLTKGGK